MRPPLHLRPAGSDRLGDGDGIILASRLRQGDVTAGDSSLLDAVAMTLVGFAVLGAKKPNALGTFIGALFLGTILQGLTQIGLSYYTQDLIKGLVLVFALIMSFSLRRRERRPVAAAAAADDDPEAPAVAVGSAYGDAEPSKEA